LKVGQFRPKADLSERGTPQLFFDLHEHIGFRPPAEHEWRVFLDPHHVEEARQFFGGIGGDDAWQHGHVVAIVSQRALGEEHSPNTLGDLLTLRYRRHPASLPSATNVRCRRLSPSKPRPPSRVSTSSTSEWVSTRSTSEWVSTRSTDEWSRHARPTNGLDTLDQRMGLDKLAWEGSPVSPPTDCPTRSLPPHPPASAAARLPSPGRPDCADRTSVWPAPRPPWVALRRQPWRRR